MTTPPALRPDPRRFEIGLYPFVVEVPPRFSDMDALGHLNNVALAAVYEEGRLALHRAVKAHKHHEAGARTVIAQVLINYAAEGFYPEALVVAGGLSRIGTSSYAIAQGLFQKGRCIGTADTVIVYTHGGGSRPMPEAMKAALGQLKIEGDGT